MMMEKYFTIGMRFRSACLAVAVLVLLGCSLTFAKELHLPVTSESIINQYTHDSILEKSEIYILPEYQKRSVRFTEQEASIPIQGDHFGIDEVTTNLSYVEVGHFNIGNNQYKVIVYNRVGEADTPLFNIQINSYNANGVLIDALLLDSQFSYEEFKQFSAFRIDPTTIEIDKFVIYTHAVVDGGEIGEALDNPTPQAYAKFIYQIDNGHFKLMSHTKIQNQQ